ncbi:MAG: hypothetical protein LC130_33625 [Bryobacterales bacterium]|nr:hypothetical protein [Bryobacterales bacterium]MEB2363711.1 hypothetical protein [Bryobacterales bacterium]
MKDRCEDEIPLRRTARQAAGRPKKTAAPTPPRIPRITRLMALAIKFQEMIDRGEVKDYAELARLGFVSRARVTQIMNLTLLAPEIQEALLRSRGLVHHLLSEHHLRRILGLIDWREQATAFASICEIAKHYKPTCSSVLEITSSLQPPVSESIVSNQS